MVLTAVNVSKSANRNGDYNATRKELKKNVEAQSRSQCLFVSPFIGDIDASVE